MSSYGWENIERIKRINKSKNEEKYKMKRQERLGKIKKQGKDRIK